MRVLVFRHVPFEDIGLLAKSLAARGIGVDYADLYLPGAVQPETGAYAGLIFMGGPMSANDSFPWLSAEMEIVRRAVAEGRPVLGICLGAQLIAKALGATVRPNPAKEIGWFGVDFTGDAATDRLFVGLRSEEVFHWHGETFDLPQGATLLASSRLCRHQAFRMGETVYGLQFHLEVTPEMIADWCQQDDNCGDVRELSAPLDPWRNSARLEELAGIVFGRWCDMLSIRGTSPGAASGSEL